MTPHLADTPILQTERLTLRAPNASDWEPCLNFMVTQRSEYMGGPYKPNDAWRGINHMIGHWVSRGYGLFTFYERESGRAMGFCGPYYPIGWAEPELGWHIWSPEDEGKGYVFEAAKAARGFAYDVLGWETAISYIAPDNARSIALAERLGAKVDPAGKLPDYADDSWEGTLVFRHPDPEALG